MEAKSLFIKESDCRENALAFILVAVLTLGLAFFFFYDDLYHRCYMVNRRRLLKAIRQGKVKVLHVRSLFANKDITEYGLDVDGERVDFWIWYDARVSAHTDGDKNAIGLFEGSMLARTLRKRLSKAVQSLASESGVGKDVLTWG
jgi:hypothetical protein